MTAAVKEDSSKKGFKSAMRALSPVRGREPQADVDDVGDRSRRSGNNGNKSSPNNDDKSSPNKGDKSSPGKTWMGTDKKKPRAEYQAEIDELQSKIAALEVIKADRDQQAARVYQLTQQVNSFNTWVRQAPRVS